MHFLYLAAGIALVGAAALPHNSNIRNSDATNDINKRYYGPSSSEISACINSVAPQYLEKDHLAVRCMCYCGGNTCANVAETEYVDMQYRLNPKIPDACNSVFNSADAGQTPPTGSGPVYQGSPYDSDVADNSGSEDEDDDEDTTASEVRVASGDTSDGTTTYKIGNVPFLNIVE